MLPPGASLEVQMDCHSVFPGTVDDFQHIEVVCGVPEVVVDFCDEFQEFSVVRSDCEVEVDVELHNILLWGHPDIEYGMVVYDAGILDDTVEYVHLFVES